MSLIWQDIEAIAGNTRASIIRLSGDAGAFVQSAVSEFIARSTWIQDDDTPVTDAQWDDIEALTAKAYTQLMTDLAIGSIFPFVTSSVPSGALECDGATHLRTDYPALYALLDSAFITDADHFKTPDLRGRTVIGVGTGSGLTARAMDASGGEETHQLTTAELASHTHVSNAHTHVANAHSHNYVPAVAAVGAALIGTPIPSAVPGAALTGNATVGIQNATNVNQNTGSDNAHNNMQPWRALRYAVWAE